MVCGYWLSAISKAVGMKNVTGVRNTYTKYIV